MHEKTAASISIRPVCVLYRRDSGPCGAAPSAAQMQIMTTPNAANCPSLHADICSLLQVTAMQTPDIHANPICTCYIPYNDMPKLFPTLCR